LALETGRVKQVEVSRVYPPSWRSCVQCCFRLLE